MCSTDMKQVSKITITLQKLCNGLQLTSYTLSAIVLVALCIYNKEYNSPMYTVETDYIKWVTPLPAITVCPAVNRRYIAQQLKRLVKGVVPTPQNITFFANLVRKGKNYYPDSSSKTLTPGNLLANITETVLMMTPPCESHINECTWNDIKFSCCQFMQPIPTKGGVCYSLNSLQTRNNERTPFNFVTSHLNPRAELKLTANSAISVHIHDRRALSFPPPRPVFQPGERGEIQYKFKETVIGSTAWELSTTKRRCVFDDEVQIKGYKAYSYSACKLNCLAEKQMQACGCKHHLLQGHNANCGLDGLKCLDIHFGNKTHGKGKCKCKKDCTEQEVSFVLVSSQITNEKKTSITVKLNKPPTERYILNARTNLIETLVTVATFFRVIAGATFEDMVYAGWVLMSSYVTFLFSAFKWIKKLFK